MLVSDILNYWYTVEVPKGPARLRWWLISSADAFSVPLLARTLFVPWRRDVVSTQGLALPERLRAFWYNLIAIFVGFTVRAFVLLIALLGLTLLGLFGLLWLLFLYIMPILPVALIVLAIFLLFS